MKNRTLIFLFVFVLSTFTCDTPQKYTSNDPTYILLKCTQLEATQEDFINERKKIRQTLDAVFTTEDRALINDLRTAYAQKVKQVALTMTDAPDGISSAEYKQLTNCIIKSYHNQLTTSGVLSALMAENEKYKELANSFRVKYEPTLSNTLDKIKSASKELDQHTVSFNKKYLLGYKPQSTTVNEKISLTDYAILKLLIIE